MEYNDDLITRVHALPPELFNLVRAEVLSCDNISAKFVHITWSYRFPKALHIDKHNRYATLQTYYSNKIFMFPNGLIAYNFVTTLSHQALTIAKGFRIMFPKTKKDDEELENDPEEAIMFDTVKYLHDRRNAQKIDFSFELKWARQLVGKGEPYRRRHLKRCVCVIENRGSLLEE